MKKTELKRYEVIEDNGGGLTLFLIENDMVVAAYSGYEEDRKPGRLLDDIKSFMTEEDALDDWEPSTIEDPQGLYDYFHNDCEHFNYAVIANENGVYPEGMGSTGKIALCISEYEITQQEVLEAYAKEYNVPQEELDKYAAVMDWDELLATAQEDGIDEAVDIMRGGCRIEIANRYYTKSRYGDTTLRAILDNAPDWIVTLSLQQIGDLLDCLNASYHAGNASRVCRLCREAL